MDPLRHQQHDQELQHGQGQQFGNHNESEYSFNNVPNDAFNPYFGGDHQQPFNPPWSADPLHDTSNHADSFLPDQHPWQQNPIRNAQYGLQSTSFDQSNSRAPASFGYPGYDNQHANRFSTPAYDPALIYNNDSLLNNHSYSSSRGSQYESTSNHGQTVSPQALQSYPSQYGGLSSYEGFQDQNDPQLGSLSHGSFQPLEAPNLFQLEEVAIPAGAVNQNFMVIDPQALIRATDSSNLSGFTFLGNNPMTYDSTEVALPKEKHRRSKQEIRQRLIGGNGKWNLSQKSRKAVQQKLKIPGASRVPKQQKTFVRIPRALGQAAPEEVSSDEEESSSAESGEDSDDYSDDDEASPLPSSRPLEPFKCIEYDVIKILWAKRRAYLASETIRNALGEYWNIVKGVRDKWKTETEGLKQAELKKDAAAIAKCKSRVVESREMIENILLVTLSHGHPSIVGKFGENAPLLVAFYQLIADRITDGEYNGSLITAILQLMSRFTTIDQTKLESTKVEKLFPKLLKRGNEDTKKLTQDVTSNFALLTRKGSKPGDRFPASVSAAAGYQLQKSTAPVARGLFAPTGVKRSRENEPVSAQSSKKSSMTSSNLRTASTDGISNTTSTHKKLANSKPVSKLSVSAPAAAAATTKAKVNHVTAKPSTFFSSLQSASKKPGTSNAALKSTQSSEKTATGSAPLVKAATTTSAAPKPAFSFAETMANLTKPKEPASTSKPEENRPAETPEEKAKRLRKEARRKLRVSFKADENLVEVRTFVHDPEEELGHDDSMVRDVSDVGGEGRMLKAHKDLDSMDEEEDPGFNDEEFAPWYLPSLVDFSVIEKGELDRNCTTRGGTVEIKSRERAVQEQRELTTLIAFYTSVADVPPSPREPSNPYAGDPVTEQEFGSPNDETRHREAQYLGRRNGTQQTPKNQSNGQSEVPSDILSVLQTLNKFQQPQQHQQQQAQATTAAASSSLEAIFAKFSSNPTAQPQSQPQAATPTPGFDFGSLGALSNQQPQQQTYATPTPQQGQTPDLQTLMWQLTQGQQGQQPAQGQSHSYQNGFQGGNERKRQFEGDEQSYNGNNNNNGQSEGKYVRGNSGKKYIGVPRVPCKFWHEGKCRKGDDCTFLHDQPQ